MKDQSDKKSINNEEIKDKSILYIVLAIILILIIILVILIMTLGKKKKIVTEDNNIETIEIVDKEEIYATLNANDLASRNGENYTSEYINKRVKVTNLIVKNKDNRISFVATGNKYFSIICSNALDLNTTEGSKISVIGIVEDSVWTADGTWHLEKCKITKE